MRRGVRHAHGRIRYKEFFSRGARSQRDCKTPHTTGPKPKGAFHRSRAVGATVDPCWDSVADDAAVALCVPVAVGAGITAPPSDGFGGDADAAALHVDVYDEDSGGLANHDFIGRVTLPWRSLVARPNAQHLVLVAQSILRDL